jgi:PIN domain nuclease of toxin-antitoxin system
LVAIEPVSNFLLLQQYASHRDAETWNQVLDERLAGWSVTVHQATSDEANALITHAEQHLGAHHSPDLFHVQHETVKATSLMLANQTRQAHQAAAEAAATVAERQQEWAACQEQCPQSAAVAELQQQAERAAAEADAADQRLETAQRRQEQASQARQGISHDYHPVDLETGEPLNAEEVQRRLDAHFDRLDEIAQEAKLSSRAKAKLAKARRVLPAMIATISFFWTTVTRKLDQWQLSRPIATWLREQLIPGYYLHLSAAKASTAKERHRRKEAADRILARARSPDGAWGTLTKEEQEDLEVKARECAAIFQRSSSCVEGHNGQLSLRHHGLHRLTARKLGALRALHNYMIQRSDGSTAAERFFGQRPQSLYAWLLERLPLPARPRQRRQAA